MKNSSLALLCGILSACSCHVAAAQADVVAPVRQFIDAFNRGDTKAASATYATGTIMIVDEFAPHRWVGPHAPDKWTAAYEKHAKATGVTDGRVTYNAPTRTEVEGDVAYVVMPTDYLYKEHGKPLAEEGRITVVLHKEAGSWRMSSWIWSGVKPPPAQ